MIPFILPALGMAKQWWKPALGFVLGAVMVFPLAQCRGEKIGRLRMEAAIARANVETLQQKARADELASNQRLADQRTTDTLERDLANAVANIPDAVPTARRLARACAQLRAQRVDTASLPQCSGTPGPAQAPTPR